MKIKIFKGEKEIGTISQLSYTRTVDDEKGEAIGGFLVISKLTENLPPVFDIHLENMIFKNVQAPLVGYRSEKKPLMFSAERIIHLKEEPKMLIRWKEPEVEIREFFDYYNITLKIPGQKNKKYIKKGLRIEVPKELLKITAEAELFPVIKIGEKEMKWEEFEFKHWTEEKNDINFLKVRRYGEGKDGACKQGFILKFTEEVLKYAVEAGEYVQYTVAPDLGNHLDVQRKGNIVALSFENYKGLLNSDKALELGQKLIKASVDATQTAMKTDKLEKKS